MTKEDIKSRKRAKKELNYYIKKLANRFIRRNRILECYDESVADIIRKAYISAYNICMHQHNIDLQMVKEEKPILEIGSKIRFDNGKLYNIEKRVDVYNREEYCLRDKNTMVCYPIDYLIGKTWEVEE